ncbi:MAG: ABC transporter permease [Flammeovirgaceae bacterium]|nr:ABC transporter permease [Flammeovirgaceae bacterium]
MRFLSFPHFVARRLQLRKNHHFSSIIAAIATGSIGLGTAVFIVSVLIFAGFKKVIQDKIFSNVAHIQVIKYDLNNSAQESPISLNASFYRNAQSIPNVVQVRPYAHKSALIRADDEVMGVILKGIHRSFDTTLFQSYLKEGHFLSLSDTAVSNEVIISRLAAKKLNLQVGQETVLYFIQNPPRVRKMRVVGIYETGLEEFDNLIVMGDLRLVQRLNDWEEDQVGGFEILLEDLTLIDQTAELIEEMLDFDLTYQLITEKYAQYFDWFIMLEQNMTIFLFIILFVALSNVISVMLILIMERTSMIGSLKALGATDAQIQKIFVLVGLRITLRGLFWGNILGLGLGFLQQKFRLIPLDPATYYMDAVPILFNPLHVLLINLLVFFLVGVVLIIPTLIIASIEPIKAIKFQ